jgi:hypothetical protein
VAKGRRQTTREPTLSDAEFNKVLELFRDEADWDHQYKYPTMALWSYHLIHRLDDTCHFQVEAPHGCREYPFVILTKTKWSKNVETELQCPDQMLFGCGDWKTCPQLWLSIYLNGWLRRHPNSLHMFTDNDDDEVGPKNLNKQYGNRVRSVCWNNADFKALEDQTGECKGLGTHSNQKYASTKAAQKGASKEQVQFRGRWIGETNSSIVSKHYISPEDIYTDAFVTSCLCKGGPIKYMLRDDATTVNDFWLFQNCVPHLGVRFATDTRFRCVMALTKLWAVFDDAASQELPLAECKRIKHSFVTVYGNLNNNPVMKVALEIMNVDGRLRIVAGVNNAINNLNNDGQQQQQPMNGNINNNPQLLALVQHNHQEVIQRIDMVQAEQQAQQAWMQQMFDRVITNQRGFGGTVYSAMATGDRQEQQRRNLQQQRVAADAAKPAVPNAQEARAPEDAAGPPARA